MLDHSYAANPINDVGYLNTDLKDQKSEVTDIDLIKMGRLCGMVLVQNFQWGLHFTVEMMCASLCLGTVKELEIRCL